MPLTQKFEERVVRVEKPSAHFALLRNEKGDFLGVSEGETAVFDQRRRQSDLERRRRHLSPRGVRPDSRCVCRE